MDALPALLKRDRLIIGAAIVATAAVAWGYTIFEAHRMDAAGVCECMGMKMSGPDLTLWSPGSVLPLFLMWAIMMVAMMLPSAAPMLLTFASVTRNRRAADRPYVPVSIFGAGYLTIWSLFSLLAAVGQWL